MCKECDNTKSWYTGTTGHTVHKRLLEHKAAVLRCDPKNALSKHMKNEHPDCEPNFTAKTVDSQRFNLQRYVSESLHIEATTNMEDVKVLNSKCEWGRKKLTRIALLDNT